MSTSVTIYFSDSTDTNLFPKDYKKVQPYLRVITMPSVKPEYEVPLRSIAKSMGVYDNCPICKANDHITVEFTGDTNTFDIAFELCFTSTNGQEINLTRINEENRFILSKIPDNGGNLSYSFNVEGVLKTTLFKKVYKSFKWSLNRR